MKRYTTIMMVIGMAFFCLGAGKKSKVQPVTVLTPTRVVQKQETVKPVLVPTPERVQQVVRLIKAQQNIAGFNAAFSLHAKGQQTEEGKPFVAKGKVWLGEGRRYRVQYEEPKKQTLVSNGKKRWLYLEAINQVQIQNLPPSGSPTEFFLELGGGLPKLIDQCAVAVVPTTKGKATDTVFELIPLPHTALNFTKVLIWTKGKNYSPYRVTVSAAREIDVQFSQINMQLKSEKRNLKEKKRMDDRFDFEVPKDAERIEMFWPVN